MRLSKEEIAKILQDRFSGNLVYMPIHITGTPVPRATAQMTGHPAVSALIATLEPHSLTRKDSGLHVKGLLHHQAGHKPSGERSA